MADPRGGGLLFFMFIRPQPYTCLGIEWWEGAKATKKPEHTRLGVFARDPIEV
jgi:hypothetical protein